MYMVCLLRHYISVHSPHRWHACLKQDSSAWAGPSWHAYFNRFSYRCVPLARSATTQRQTTPSPSPSTSLYVR